MARILRTVVLLLGLVPAQAWAATKFDEAMRFFWEMDFNKAMDVANRMIKSPESQPNDLAQAYSILGLCYSAMNKKQEAVRMFQRVLAIDPTLPVGEGTAPEVLAPYRKAKELFSASRPIGLEHAPPDPVKALAGCELEMQVASDPLAMVKAIRLKFKLDDSAEEQQVIEQVRKRPAVRLLLPDTLAGREMFYSLEAVNEYGAVLARLDAGGKPFRIGVAGAVAAAPASPKRLRRFEVELYTCILGSFSEQGGSAGDNRIVLNQDPRITARLGMSRWGPGVRFGYRPFSYHQVFTQVDLLWERWIGTVEWNPPAPWDNHLNLIRVLAGYQFAYPVLPWLEPFAELGVGAHLYLPSVYGISGAMEQEVKTAPDHRFALLLGIGVRFVFRERFHARIAYLWDLPLAEVSSSSFIVGGGIAF